jgi:hypothetical protein
MATKPDWDEHSYRKVFANKMKAIRELIKKK